MDLRGYDASPDFVTPRSLYIHIPLCASKCAYCDFFSVAASPRSPDYDAVHIELVDAILERASILSERFGADGYETVYIGGGTPTILSLDALARLLEGLGRLSMGSRSIPPKEWTVEANPDSLDAENLELMRSFGVTRLSIGVQSLDPDELGALGRRHGPEAALGAVRLGANAGMAVSADLIAGIPAARDSARDYGDSGKLARFALELIGAGAKHLSVYDLTVEEGTPLAAAKDRYRFPGEDEDWEARQRLEASIRAIGMRRYEVSNYAGKGDECLHNLAYWRMDSYVGAGPGAVSTIGTNSGTSLRIEERKRIEDYRRLAGAEAKETRVGLRDSAFEALMMAFRTSFGLELESFRRRFGREAEDLIGDSLRAWSARIVAGEPLPGASASRGPALDGRGLDLLNRFLLVCMGEMESKLPETRE